MIDLGAGPCRDAGTGKMGRGPRHDTWAHQLQSDRAGMGTAYGVVCISRLPRRLSAKPWSSSLPRMPATAAVAAPTYYHRQAMVVVAAALACRGNGRCHAFPSHGKEGDGGD